MIDAAKSIRILIVAATVISWLTFPAHPPGLQQKGWGIWPPVEAHSKVNENAYKALDRIPTPQQEIGPLGNSAAFRTSEHREEIELRWWFRMKRIIFQHFVSQCCSSFSDTP
jgi:hypothetical protein